MLLYKSEKPNKDEKPYYMDERPNHYNKNPNYDKKRSTPCKNHQIH
jgi:hypothetical protein